MDNELTSKVLVWNRVACDAIYYTKMEPTVASRALAMLHTAMYDAWSAYYPGRFLSTTTGDRFKMDAGDCNEANREKAYCYAAYHLLLALFSEKLPNAYKSIFKTEMRTMNFDPDADVDDKSKPEGIGYFAAKMVLDCRKYDGANQEEDYKDYTNYKPVNMPPPKRPLKFKDRWQPQRGKKNKAQVFMTPHWGLVKPFAIEWGGQFRPEPPKWLSEGADFEAQLDEILALSRDLTDKQKLSAEFWAGMHEDKYEDNCTVEGHDYWVTPPAQCCRIAQFIAHKNEFKDTYAITFFFVLCNALMDAGIAAWDAKVYYNYCRPDSIIHEHYDDKVFMAWGQNCNGAVEMQGDNWKPFLLESPPFAEYVSGHSAFTSAMAEIISCFNKSGKYEGSVTIPAKGSKIEPECTPEQECTLYWYSVDDAATDAGMSRRYGGIHFKDGDLNGRALGRKVAEYVWKKVKSHYWCETVQTK